MASGGSMLIDGCLERMRRRRYVDVIYVADDYADRARGGATPAQRNHLFLHGRKLRHGHDDPDGRRGRFSRL